jgi:hypothetical protein
VTVNGFCFPPNTDNTVVLTSDPVTLGTVRTDAAGNFSAQFRIPATTPAGIHTITVRGSAASAQATVNVVSAAGVLGVTGTSAGRLLMLGIACIAFGALLTIVRRRGYRADDWSYL